MIDEARMRTASVAVESSRFARLFCLLRVDDIGREARATKRVGVVEAIAPDLFMRPAQRLERGQALDDLVGDLVHDPSVSFPWADASSEAPACP